MSDHTDAAYYAIYIPSKEHGKLYLCPVDGKYVLKNTLRGAAIWSSLENAESVLPYLRTVDAKVERIEREGVSVVKAKSCEEARNVERELNGDAA